MSKKNLKLSMAIVIAAMLVIACQKEVLDKFDNNSQVIEEAQAWFESIYTPVVGLKSGNTKKINVQGDWEHAFKTEDDEKEVVEVGLISQQRFGFAMQKSIERWDETGNMDYLSSVPRIVVVKNKKDCQMRSFIMTTIGDPDYLAEKKPKLWKNTYLKKEKDFKGLVFFHTLEGEFINGWRFEDGEVTGKVTQTSDDGTSLTLKTEEMIVTCSEYLIIGWFQDCNQWIQITEFDMTYYEECGAPYMREVGSFEICDIVGNGEAENEGSDESSFDPNKPKLLPTYSPCFQADVLAVNAGFISKMKDLRDNTSLSYETGYVLKQGSGNNLFAYEYVQGEAGADEININIGEPIEGLVHAHYTGLLPIFSPADMKAIFDAFEGGNVTNLTTFTAGVVTASGTTYLLKVEDEDKFIDFGFSTLKDSTTFRSFAWTYENAYHITETSTNTQSEKAFIQLLEQYNTGLKLFKGNTSSFNSWTLRGLNGSTVINDDCNE